MDKKTTNKEIEEVEDKTVIEENKNDSAQKKIFYYKSKS